MGRSVESIGSNVVYFNFECEEDFFQDEWDDLVDCLIYTLQDKYKSFDTVKDKWADWPYRENQIILENYQVKISVSMYCGCGAVSVFVDGQCEYPELAEHWLEQCWPKIEKLIQDSVPCALKRIGGFSNGESVYEKVIE